MVLVTVWFAMTLTCSSAGVYPSSVALTVWFPAERLSRVMGEIPALCPSMRIAAPAGLVLDRDGAGLWPERCSDAGDCTRLDSGCCRKRIVIETGKYDRICPGRKVRYRQRRTSCIVPVDYYGGIGGNRGEFEASGRGRNGRGCNADGRFSQAYLHGGIF